MSATRTFRIYLAAVAGQMDGERAVIDGLVLPELRSRAEEMRLAVELIDPMAAKGDAWDLARRLEEIDACRPFLVALVGERYGDPPLAVPPALVESHPWLADDPGRSVLELELVHAALRDPGGAAGAFFYLRDPRFSAAVPEQSRSRFLPETGRAGARLAGLKERLRGCGRPVFDGYACAWSDSLERASRLDTLAERMIEDLWPAIEAEAEEPTPAEGHPAHGRLGELAEPAPPLAPGDDLNATVVASAFGDDTVVIDVSDDAAGAEEPAPEDGGAGDGPRSS